MARISVSANEEVIATGIGTTTVSNGRFVRIVNTTGATAAVFVVDANSAGIGSFTMLNNTVEVVEKHREDKIYFLGTGALKVSRIGITA